MQQLSLLAPPAPSVPGLAYVTDYVTRMEERALLEAIDQEPWSCEWQRRRQIYGLSYGGARAAGTFLGPLPAWIAPLAERVVREGWLAREVVNVVVNEYMPGQGIGLHRDYPGFGSTVVAVSLGSACALDLVNAEDGTREVLDVAPRSLWVLGGEARTRWLHGIAHRKSDVLAGVRRPRGRRVSVTMRTLRAP